MKTANQILQEIAENNRKRKWPALSLEDSKTIRKYYKRKLLAPVNGNPTCLIFTGTNQPVAIGYERIVIGDYGAYVEFSESQIIKANIKPKWPGKPRRPVKYIWMETTEPPHVKVYFQQDTVQYADYKVGMYYIDPCDIWIKQMD